MDPYTQPKRAFDGGFDTTVSLATSGDDQVLVAAKQTTPSDAPKQHIIHVQRISVVPRTTAAVTWTVRDAASNVIVALFSMAALGQQARDIGPQGLPLTINSDLVLDVSATGAAGDLYIEGFQERTTEDI